MPNRVLHKNTYYHVYNRGCNKQKLFFEYRDFKRFWGNTVRYLEDYKLIRVYAWCFLPNHFHLLLMEKGEGKEPGLEEVGENVKPGLPFQAKQISNFMNKIQQSYAMYFNSKYKEVVKQGRKSPVFEGRFKAKPITDKKYLAQVAYYIRHNALKHDIVDDSQDWPWAGVTASEDFPAMKYTGVNPEFDPGFD